MIVDDACRMDALPLVVQVYACGLNNYGQLGRAPGLPYYKYTLMPELSGKKVRVINNKPTY